MSLANAKKVQNADGMCRCLVVDANLPGIVIDRIMKEGKERGSLVIFEPVSVEKSRKLIR